MHAWNFSVLSSDLHAGGVSSPFSYNQVACIGTVQLTSTTRVLGRLCKERGFFLPATLHERVELRSSLMI